MKNRTIEDIHDEDIGNKKFAWFVDTAIEDGHTITHIKEYYEKYKFEMDGRPMEFWILGSEKGQLEFCYRMLETHELIKQLQNGQKQ